MFVLYCFILYYVYDYVYYVYVYRHYRHYRHFGVFENARLFTCTNHTHSLTLLGHHWPSSLTYPIRSISDIDPSIDRYRLALLFPHVTRTFSFFSLRTHADMDCGMLLRRKCYLVHQLLEIS